MNKILVALLFWALILCSCGGDESTKVVDSQTSNFEVYKTIKDLEKCTEDNEGQLAWITKDRQMRICVDGEWFAVKSELVDDVEIIFKDDAEVDTSREESCYVLKVQEDTLRIPCDSLSFVVSDTKPEEEEPIVLDSEQIALDLESVSGFSQKGPFLTGSAVQIFELQNGRTLKQTGNLFESKISNSKGAFDVRTVKLTSQYAYVVAKGLYRNEVDGNPSSTQIMLVALTDLRNRNHVNVNVLTNLEYERIVYLVTEKKKTVAQAKKIAEAEIFDDFYVDHENFVGYSEDLNIGGASDADAALLAISILLQRNLSVTGLSKELEQISSSIAKDSVWRDSVMKLEIAQWAASTDSSGGLSKIRTNISKWNLFAIVPEFERYVRNFWNKEYGLGDCDSIGKIVASNRKGVSKSSRFVCEEKNGVYGWRFALGKEADLYGLKQGSDGELFTKSVSGTVYVYDSVLAQSGRNGWREANDLEKKYGGCRKEISGKIVRDTVQSGYGDDLGCFMKRLDNGLEISHFFCNLEDHQWSKVNDCVMLDTYGWKSAKDGVVQFGDSIGTSLTYIRDYDYVGTKICYVYDSLAGSWATTDSSSCLLSFGGCTAARYGKYFKDEEAFLYYRCSEKGFQNLGTEMGVNVWNKKCVDWTAGLVKSDNYFVCDNEMWRKATSQESELKQPCLESMDAVFTEDSSNVCYNREHPEYSYTFLSGWYRAEYFDFPLLQKDYLSQQIVYDSIRDPRDNHVYKTVKIGSDTWMAENLVYYDAKSVVLNKYSYCKYSLDENCEKGGRMYTWTAAMNLDVDYTYSSAASDGIIGAPHQGVCPVGWHIPSTDDWNALFKETGSYNALVTSNFPGKTYENANSSGFSGIPLMDFSEPELKWWVADESSSSLGYIMQLHEYNTPGKEYRVENPGITDWLKSWYLPVRCVKDKDLEG